MSFSSLYRLSLLRAEELSAYDLGSRMVGIARPPGFDLGNRAVRIPGGQCGQGSQLEPTADDGIIRSARIDFHTVIVGVAQLTEKIHAALT